MKHDVHLDLARIRSLPDEQLAERLGVPVAVVPALRGTHDLNEAGELARTILEAPSVSLPEERADARAVPRAARGRERRPRQATPRSRSFAS